MFAGTIAPTLAGARASSCSASTPLSSVTPSCGRLPVPRGEHVLHPRDHVRVVAAEREHAVAGDQVEVAVAVGIDQVGAIAADPRPVEPERPQDPPHLRVEVAVVERQLLADALRKQFSNFGDSGHRP